MMVAGKEPVEPILVKTACAIPGFLSLYADYISSRKFLSCHEQHAYGEFTHPSFKDRNQ